MIYKLDELFLLNEIYFHTWKEVITLNLNEKNHPLLFEEITHVLFYIKIQAHDKSKNVKFFYVKLNIWQIFI